ncbi:MAG: hypothetical protein JOZ25_02410 [Actinobacteria bacterium]|nr:hypothetical protein [Actinomycetota bacterium]
MRRLRLVLSVVTAAPAVAAATVAIGAPNPLNDLFALGQAGGDTPAQVPWIQGKENLKTTPVVKCGPGSRKEPGVDGRVPAGSAPNGLNCNIKLIAHQGTEGGFKVLRYIDANKHECAFYDQTLMLPLNALNPGAGAEGVAVLDMSNPAHPALTDTLTTPPMLSPHESLNLSSKRGLLVAVNGNLTTEPGFVAVYDVRSDCRHPVLDSLGAYARFGHESGFSADGKTFYATSTALRAITAIDLTDPKNPTAVWQGNILSHGMSLSANGNRAYIADPGYTPNQTHGGLLILDTSQIQARKPNPQTHEISRLTWPSISIPQNAIPFTENGRPYLLEIDEYNQSTLHYGGDADVVGAARIIDISNEKKPFIVSDLRLAIDQHAAHKAASGDPGASSPAQGYAAHYCNIPTPTNPKVVACSFIASGLRVFDISKLKHPKEIAYYVAPPKPRSENGYSDSDFAMSKPAFVPERREIWWSDGTSGFYVLRVAKSVWPHARKKCATAHDCDGKGEGEDKGCDGPHDG